MTDETRIAIERGRDGGPHGDEAPQWPPEPETELPTYKLMSRCPTCRQSLYMHVPVIGLFVSTLVCPDGSGAFPL